MAATSTPRRRHQVQWPPPKFMAQTEPRLQEDPNPPLRGRPPALSPCGFEPCDD
ncbi:hypothetical protein ACP70R_018300 [Stipagrostis hirtigluma subsp. patula]